jgi:hypothetical protein
MREFYPNAQGRMRFGTPASSKAGYFRPADAKTAGRRVRFDKSLRIPT